MCGSMYTFIVDCVLWCGFGDVVLVMVVVYACVNDISWCVNVCVCMCERYFCFTIGVLTNVALH